ncbi:hypothetical protein IQ273_09310 [Nodosilinea sp. LEGE 07298]|uniref:DUF6492 family protein n=1 Tax=Nodosilinea sp. LEGE 07298 TaxID=2777970 RepID=UPI00187E2437|nr:DUF6492 family protein [Nodosilinea sp. LEGE 07298]MBE9109614.1 hypothetical protein [Nodosilinea sp. LEGE 07298]
MSSSVSSSFALVTPSYGPDFERCRLLVESVGNFSQTPMQHYIIVDQRDYSQFQSLAYGSTEIITVESLLPIWIHRLPLVRKAWLSLKTPPIRNWVLQQLVKLSFAESAPEQTTIFVDSDVAFIRPFDLTKFSQEGQTRLFRVPEFYAPEFDPLYAAAYRLLRLEGDCSETVRPNYIGNLISWRQSNVKALRNHLERVWDRPWLETLARSKTLSEYILYGVFVDQVLGESANHFYDWSPLCHEYWQTQPLNDQQLAAFFAAAQPSHIAVMVSSKARIEPSRYQPYLHHHRDTNVSARP